MMDKSRYPPDWPAISLRIRERAGNRCEWCGVENGAVGARDKQGKWHDENSIHNMNSDVGYALYGEFPKMIKIVLRVVCHPDPANYNDDNLHSLCQMCRNENLASLCQRCHLGYDRDEHHANAAATRRRRKVEAGQLVLPLGLDPPRGHEA